MSNWLDISPETPAFTAARLKLARERRGCTIASLAEALGVTSKTVARWESRETRPSPENVSKIAEILSFPSSFFAAADDLDELPEDAVSFRAPSKMSARLRSSALASGRLAVQLSDHLERRFRLPVPDVPTLPRYDPETAADVVRERWGIGTRPISNLLHLVEAHGVRVFTLPADIRQVDAFSFYSSGKPICVVSTAKTAERQRFDLAHELGHLVLHCEERRPSGREAEVQAHRFAAAFLMPREDVVSKPLWQADAQRILHAKARWGVAAMALTHRLRELNMTSEWGYRDACVILSQSGYRREEPDSRRTPETSQVLGKIFAALRSGPHRSLQDLADELALTPKELSQYVFGLVPFAVPESEADDSEQAAEPNRPRLRLVSQGRKS